MRFFEVLHLKKKPHNIIIHVGAITVGNSGSYKKFHEIQNLRNFILKYSSSPGVTVSTRVLHGDKANANGINKDFTELVKVESNLDYISH